MAIRFSAHLLILAIPLAIFASHAHGAINQEPRGTRTLESSTVYHPQMTEDFLFQEGSRQNEPPRLYVSRFNINDGLYAGFQAHGGKRIIFWSAVRPDGTLIARAFDQDPETGGLRQILTIAPFDPNDGESTPTIWIMGANLNRLLEVKRFHRAISTEDELRLKEFMRSETGLAFLQAVPALYVELEMLEESRMGSSGLLVPFGIIRMAMESTTGLFSGFEHADATVGSARAQELRSRCIDERCQYRGRFFTIQESGLFDVLSDRGRQRDGLLTCGLTDMFWSGSDLNGDFILVQSGCGSGSNCFGMCGLGCLSPIPWLQICTEECRGHDQCVETYGHISCMLGTPSGCSEEMEDGECYNLIEATISFVNAVFGGNTGGGGGPPPSMWPNGPYYTPDMIGMTFCTYDIYCIDPPGGPGGPGYWDPQ